jgi:sarcosine oxidase subunit gamma
MAEEGTKHNPLAGVAEQMAAASVAGPRGVDLREGPFLAQIDLRSDPADPAFLAAVRAALALDIPLRPNTTARSQGGRAGHPITAYWLGPDEWLLVGPEGTEGELERMLREALAGVHSSVVDVSANRSVLELSGPRAREVLLKGCSLDLHPRRFASGQCAQTLLARAQVLLHQVGDEPAYRLFVRPSFALYLATWLIDAMAEYRADPS